jgi:signal transduction histidine kinase
MATTSLALDALRASPLFAELPADHLQRLAAGAKPMTLQPGDFLIIEGEQADDLYVVVSGELEVTKRSGNAEIPLARVGPGAIQGELAALERGQRMASVRALTETEVLRIPFEAVLDLLSAGPDAALGIIRTVISRLRGMEATLRQREKLAALGTLSAGLAHELNNPAAAIRRSAEALTDAVARRGQAAYGIVASEPKLARLIGATPTDAGKQLDGLERADRADEIAAILRRVGLPESAEPDNAAAVLVGAGWTAPDIETAAAELEPAEIEPAVAWLSSVAAGDELLSEIRMAAGRISEIVGAVKSYAFLDQAPVQRVDVRRGLDDTLIILRHKLKGGIEVTRDYAPDLPEIEAWGSELNQVWTNLIDNASDAMDGKGEISIRAEATDEGGVAVSICDNGPGIPPDVANKIFEPFFTTKPPGIGSGLGLHISHNVIVRHGGRIDLETKPGRTCFIVTLPPTVPKGAAAIPRE